MKRIDATVEYNSDFGYIITSATRIYNWPGRTISEPAIIALPYTPPHELGALIRKAIDITRTVKALTKEEADASAYKYWYVSKIKSYAAYSKKFQSLTVREKGNEYMIVELVRSKNGGYIHNKDKEPTVLSIEASNEELGQAVKNVFLDIPTFTEDTLVSFTTLNGSKVIYNRPSDNFIDIGDGHTDAYQIYVYEEVEGNDISFLVDNNYETFDESDIYIRWNQMFPDIKKFEFKRIDTGSLYAVVTAETSDRLLLSNFYYDGEYYFEVATSVQINKLHPQLQEKIQNEMTILLDSVTVEVKQELLVDKDVEIKGELPAYTKIATTEPKEPVPFSTNRGHKTSPKKRKPSFLDPVINIIAIIFHPAIFAITAFLLFLIIGFYRQNAPVKAPTENWVDLYTVTKTFTNDTFTVIKDIPEDELVAVSAKVYHIESQGNMVHYYLRNLKNRREHFRATFPPGSYRNNDVFLLYFTTTGMTSGNLIDKKTVLRENPVVHKEEITISIDYWDVHIQRIITRSGDNIPIGSISKYSYKDGFTDAEWEYIDTHNIDVSALLKKIRIPKALIILGSIILFIIVFVKILEIKSTPKSPKYKPLDKNAYRGSGFLPNGTDDETKKK